MGHITLITWDFIAAQLSLVSSPSAVIFHGIFLVQSKCVKTVKILKKKLRHWYLICLIYRSEGYKTEFIIIFESTFPQDLWDNTILKKIKHAQTWTDQIAFDLTLPYIAIMEIENTKKALQMSEGITHILKMFQYNCACLYLHYIYFITPQSADKWTRLCSQTQPSKMNIGISETLL